MANFGRKMWGWKHSLVGVSNTELQPFMPISDGNLKDGTYAISYSGANYNKSIDENDYVSTGFLYLHQVDGNDPSVDLKGSFGDWESSSSLMTNAKTVDDVVSFSFDLQDNFFDGYPSTNPDHYATLAVNAIRPLELETELRFPETFMRFYAANGYSGQSTTQWPGYNALLGFDTFDSNGFGSQLYPYTHHLKNVAGTQSLACRYHVSRVGTETPFNWNEKEGATNVYFGDNLTENYWRTKDYFCSTDRPSGYDTISYYNWRLPFAGKGAKSSGDIIGDPPDMRHGVDISFEVELALQRYGVDTTTVVVAADQNAAFEPAWTDNPDLNTETLSYVAGHCCFGSLSGSDYTPSGDCLFVPVYVKMRTWLDGTTSGYDISDISNQGIISREYGIPLNSVRGKAYKYLVVAIKLERRYSPSSIIPGSGVVLDLEVPSEDDSNLTQKSAFNICSGKNNGYLGQSLSVLTEEQWPLVRFRESLKLFDTGTQDSASYSNIRCKVGCLRVSEDAQYLFYSGGTLWNQPPGSGDIYNDIAKTRKFISRVNAPSAENQASKFFWHATGTSLGTPAVQNDNTVYDPWLSAASSLTSDSICQTLDFRYGENFAASYQVAPGYNGDDRIDNDFNSPSQGKYDAFIKSFRFSNDGKFLYILWVTDTTLDNLSSNTIYQWVERWWTNEPKGYGSQNFRLGQYNSGGTYPYNFISDGFYFAGTTNVHSITGNNSGFGYIESASSIDVTPDGLYLQVLANDSMINPGSITNKTKPVLLEYFLGGVDNSLDNNSSFGIIGSTSPRMAQTYGLTLQNPKQNFTWPNNIVSPGAYDSNATYGNASGSTSVYIVVDKTFREQRQYKKIVSTSASDMIECFGGAAYNGDSQDWYPNPVDFSWNADGTELYLFGAAGATRDNETNPIAFREGNPFVYTMTMYPYQDGYVARVYPDTLIDENNSLGNQYDFLYLNRILGLSNFAVSHGLTAHQGILYPSSFQTERTISATVVHDNTNNRLSFNGVDWGSPYRLTFKKSTSDYGIKYKLFLSDVSFINDTVSIRNNSGTILGESDGFYITEFGTPGQSGAYIEVRIDESATISDFRLYVNGTAHQIIYLALIDWLEYCGVPLYRGSTLASLSDSTNSEYSANVWETPFNRPSFSRFGSEGTDASSSRALLYSAAQPTTGPNGPLSTPYYRQWNTKANLFAYHKGGQFLYTLFDRYGSSRLEPDTYDTLYDQELAVYPIYTNVRDVVYPQGTSTVLPLFGYWGYGPDQQPYQYKNWKWVGIDSSVVGPRIPGHNVADEGDCDPSPQNRDWGAMYLNSTPSSLRLNIITQNNNSGSNQLYNVQVVNYGTTKGTGYQGTVNLALKKTGIQSSNKPYYRYNTNIQSEVQGYTPGLFNPIRHAFLTTPTEQAGDHMMLADVRGGKNGYWFGFRGDSYEMWDTIKWGVNNLNSYTGPLLNSTFLTMNWCDNNNIREFLYLPQFKVSMPSIESGSQYQAQKVTYSLMQQMNEQSTDNKSLYVVKKNNYNSFAYSSFGIAAKDKTPLTISPSFSSYYESSGSLSVADIYYNQQSDQGSSYYQTYSNKSVSVRSFRFADDGKKFYVLLSGQIEQTGSSTGSSLGFSLRRYNLSDPYNLDTATSSQAYTHKEESSLKSYWWGNTGGGSDLWPYFGSDFYIKPDGTRFWVIGLDTSISTFGQAFSSQGTVVVREFSLSTPWDFSTISDEGFDTYDTQGTSARTSKIHVPVDLEVSPDGSKVYWSHQFAQTVRQLNGSTSNWGIEHWVSELTNPYDLKNPTDFTTQTVIGPNNVPVTRTVVGEPWAVESGAAQKIRFISQDRLYRNGLSKPSTIYPDDPYYRYRITPNWPVGGVSAFDLNGNNFQKEGGSFSIGNMGMFPSLVKGGIGDTGGVRKVSALYDMFLFAVNPEQDVVAISDTQLKIYHGKFNNSTKGF
tara:strand:+ start:1473 stop:7259 length:5787 start_codon:yes stop_codon:yes gene_type:complete